LLEIAAVACIVILASPSFSPTKWVFSATHSGAAALWMVEGGATCLGSAFLIFVLATGSGWISVALGSRPMVFLGEISFAIYMLHQIGLRLCGADLDLFASWPNWMAIGVFLIGLVACAAALWWFFERPARSMIVNMRSVRLRAMSPPTPQRRSKGHSDIGIATDTF
jgi:peptidoglycan/LPS O-acetylase OafA/YrhL